MEPFGVVEMSRGATNFWTWDLFTGPSIYLKIVVRGAAKLFYNQGSVPWIEKKVEKKCSSILDIIQGIYSFN